MLDVSVDEKTLLRNSNSYHSKLEKFVYDRMLITELGTLCSHDDDWSPRWPGWGNHPRWMFIHNVTESRLRSLPSPW